jgi:hypothetical protein
VVAKQFIFDWSHGHCKKQGKETETEKDKETDAQK